MAWNQTNYRTAWELFWPCRYLAAGQVAEVSPVDLAALLSKYRADLPDYAIAIAETVIRKGGATERQAESFAAACARLPRRLFLPTENSL